MKVRGGETAVVLMAVAVCILTAGDQEQAALFREFVLLVTAGVIAAIL